MGEGETSVQTPNVAVAGHGVAAMHAVRKDEQGGALAKSIPIFIAPHFLKELESAREAIKHRKLLFPQLSKQYHPPPYHALNMVKTVFYMLGYSMEELGDPSASDPKKFHWPSARRLFTSGFVQELLTFDPSEEDDHDGLFAAQMQAKAVANGATPQALLGDDALPPYMRALNMKHTVENLLDKEVMEQGPAFKALLKWIRVAVEIRATSVEQRERTRILRAAGL